MSLGGPGIYPGITGCNYPACMKAGSFMDKTKTEHLHPLYAQVDGFHIITMLQDRIRDMLCEAYDLGHEQASADSCGCVLPGILPA